MQCKIHLRSTDPDVVTAWRHVFAGESQIEISHGDIFGKDFEKTLSACDALVSPANSFGYMEGGFDKHILRYFGKDTQKSVQTMIKAHHAGELIVGKSMLVDLGHPLQLICCPTVRTSRDDAEHSVNAYLAFKGLLRLLSKHPEIKRVVVPGLCTGVANMPPMRSAVQMHFAYLAHTGRKAPQSDVTDILKIYDHGESEQGMLYNDRFMRTIKRPY